MVSKNGVDWCLVGEKSAGKSHLSKQIWEERFSSSHQLSYYNLYRDMSARDLLQRRVTDERGNTCWEDSPLVRAAVNGHFLILDGLHRLSASAVAALRPLIHDRELVLPDGTLLIRHDRFTTSSSPTSLSSSSSTSAPVRAIHPDFHLLALAEPPTRDAPWLTADLLNMFAYREVNFLAADQLTSILTRNFSALSPETIDSLVKLFSLAPQWQSGLDQLDVKHQQRLITLRHVFRIARRLCKYPEDFFESVCRAAMLPHMPPPLRESFVSFLSNNCNILPPATSFTTATITAQIPTGFTDAELVRLLNIQPRASANLELVPKATNFYPMPSQIRILQTMLKDWELGERHLLLIGPQGTGKVRSSAFSLLCLRSF